MVIGKAIRDYLRSDAGIVAIVGKKVHLRKVPARVSFPFVVISIAGVDFPTRSNAPRAGGSEHRLKVRVQVDVFTSEKTSATAEEDVDRLAEAIAEALDDHSGTTNGVTIVRSRQVDERDNYERLQDGSDDGVHRITQEYEVIHAEPTS